MDLREPNVGAVCTWQTREKRRKQSQGAFRLDGRLGVSHIEARCEEAIVAARETACDDSGFHVADRLSDDDNGWMPLRRGSLDKLRVAGHHASVLVPRLPVSWLR